jgi:hypothetical protein
MIGTARGTLRMTTRRSTHLLPTHTYSGTCVAAIDVPHLRPVDLQGPELQHPERDAA